MCVFSDGRRAGYHLDGLPNPRLARDLADGLVDLIHPHGTADSGGTVIFYVQALRAMVRAFAAAGFTGGAADLRRGQLAEFWMAGPMRLEALTRSMVEGFARSGGPLGEGVASWRRAGTSTSRLSAGRCRLTGRLTGSA